MLRVMNDLVQLVLEETDHEMELLRHHRNGNQYEVDSMQVVVLLVEPVEHNVYLDIEVEAK